MKSVFDQLKDLGLTEQKIKNFLERQNRFVEISEKIKKKNRKFLGQNNSVVVLDTPEKMLDYVIHSYGKPENALRRLERRQKLEKQRHEQKGYTSAIYTSVYYGVYALRTMFQNVKQTAETISSNISPDELSQLDKLLASLEKYKEMQREADEKGDMTSFLLSERRITEIRQQIYDLLIEVASRTL